MSLKDNSGCEKAKVDVGNTLCDLFEGFFERNTEILFFVTLGKLKAKWFIDLLRGEMNSRG